MSHSRRAAAFLSVAVIAIPGLTAPALATSATPHRQRCHDFTRFGERWELCRNADGTVERHRIGVLPRS